MSAIFGGRTRWIIREHGARLPSLAPEVVDLLALCVFWLIVWGLKILAARFLLMPILLESHSLIVNAFPLSALTAADGGGAATQLLLRLQPRMLLRAALQVVLWGTGGAIYLADTLGWYQLVLGVWGGGLGLLRFGVAPAGHFFNSAFYSDMKRYAYFKLLPSLCADQIEIDALEAAASATHLPFLNTRARHDAVSVPRRAREARRQSDWAAKCHTPHPNLSNTKLDYHTHLQCPHTSSPAQPTTTNATPPQAWKTIWSSLVDDLYGRCLLSSIERDSLLQERPISLGSAE